jgi:hypothetical protein
MTVLPLGETALFGTLVIKYQSWIFSMGVYAEKISLPAIVVSMNPLRLFRISRFICSEALGLPAP